MQRGGAVRAVRKGTRVVMMRRTPPHRRAAGGGAVLGTRRRRGAVVGLAAAAVLGACVGCSSAGSAGAAGPTGAADASQSATGAPGPAPATDASSPPSPAASSGSAAGGSSPAPGAAQCQNGALRTGSAPAGAGAGHVGMVLTFTNTGSAPCTLYGYPGAVLVGAGGRTVLDAERTMSGYLGGDASGGGPSSVTLAPGAAASALLEWSDVPTAPGAPVGANCPGMGSLHLLVTPPNTTATVSLAAIGSACQGFEVHPVVPGTTGGR
jgi:uncharacterized protein DUF4232